MDQTETLTRILYYEFLIEPGLLAETGLEDIPSRLALLLNCKEKEALAKLIASPLLEKLTLDQLCVLLTIRDMTFISKTAAALSAELKSPDATYHDCCRMALAYAVLHKTGHVFSALRAAASKNDTWARHHYLYGLVLGIEGNRERAIWELNIALKYEPYEDGRIRIRRTLDTIEAKK